MTSTSAPERIGILLFAHGARDPNWAKPFDAAKLALIDRLKSTAGAENMMHVELAFLEFMAPDLATAGAQLVENGCTSVCVVPLFLGAGGHVRKDLPQLMATLASHHPTVNWSLKPAVGETDILIQALASSALSLALS